MLMFMLIWNKYTIIICFITKTTIFRKFKCYITITSMERSVIKRRSISNKITVV